jgi:hypothetical protein
MDHHEPPHVDVIRRTEPEPESDNAILTGFLVVAFAAFVLGGSLGWLVGWLVK